MGIRDPRFCGKGWGLIPMILLATQVRGDVTYQAAIRPLFQASCLSCHNPDKQKAGLDLSTYDATMDGSDNGKVVITGSPDKSLLLKVLTHEEEPYMPKGGDKLPDNQIAMIRQWIEANAPNQSGQMAAKASAGPSIAVVPAEEKPKGPAAMPRDGLLEPVIHTVRRGAVPSVAGSPWAPLVALAAQKQVLLYNTDSLELVGILPFPEGFPAIVRFSHNGSLLIAGGGVGAKLGHVVLWDVITGRRVAEIGDEFDTVLAADISPDQRLVALGGPSRLVKIFSVSDGHMICKMKKHTDWVTALSFTPDGKSLISGDRAGGLSVWDTQGHELQSVSAHTGAITGIACQGNLVATSSEDGTVKIWDIVQDTQVKSWKAHFGGVRSVAVTPDGKIVTSGRDKLVRVWDANGNAIKQFEPLSDIAMQATVAGGKIIAADWNGLVPVWTADGKKVGNLESNPPTIAQRINMLSKSLAELGPLQVQADAARAQAADALAGLRKRAADNLTTIDSRKKSLGTVQTRITTLQQQIAAAAADLKKGQAVKMAAAPVLAELRPAGLADPILQPAALWAFGFSAKAAQFITGQNLVLTRWRAALTESAHQRAAIVAEIANRSRAVAPLNAAVKSAAIRLAAAQAAADKTAAEIKDANARLLRWRTAQSRLAPAPQYAARKNEPGSGGSGDGASGGTISPR